MTEMHHESRSGKSSYEVRDINARLIGKLSAYWILIAIIIQLSMWGLFKEFKKTEERSDRPFSSVQIKPSVQSLRLQYELPKELFALREDSRNQLNSYGWIKREAGVVHIPIDRAIQLFLEKHAQPQINKRTSQKGVT